MPPMVRPESYARRALENLSAPSRPGPRSLWLPGRGRQDLAGLFAQTLDAPRTNTHTAQFLQQFNHLPATLAEAAGEDRHPSLQPGAKGGSANLDRQLRLHPGLTMGTPAGQQAMFSKIRANFRPLPCLMPFSGSQWFPPAFLQKTMAVRTGFRPLFHNLIHLSGGQAFPMIALMIRLTAWRSPIF